ncbi:hypothetical protein A6R68_24075, partial [Neotoma lepida]
LEQCVRCPEKYANLEQTHCLQRAVSFLAYEEPLGMALVFMALPHSSSTRHLCELHLAHVPHLLFSLLIAFHWASQQRHLYILQQTTFGVFFTVAVSTVLAQTITVVLTFRLDIPGRRMRGMHVSGTPNFSIPICILVQLDLCGIWLVMSPPFFDSDISSEHEKTTIFSNKVSDIAFHFVLGHL